MELLTKINELNIYIYIYINVYKNRKTDLKIHMELLGTLNCQNHLEKVQRWMTYISQFQNLLQSNSNQNSVALL